MCWFAFSLKEPQPVRCCCGSLIDTFKSWLPLLYVYLRGLTIVAASVTGSSIGSCITWCSVGATRRSAVAASTAYAAYTTCSATSW